MKRILIFILFLLLHPLVLQAADYPVTFTDSAGKTITLTRQPERIVSLVPSVSEMLIRIGAEDTVVGSTHHSLFPFGNKEREVVGGFFRPDLDRVAALQPDVIFYAELHKEVVARFQGKIPIVCLAADSIAESYGQVSLLGRLFGREQRAMEIVSEQKRQLQVIAKKIQTIPPEKRQRVVRLMGSDPLMVPGDDSFQNEYIRSAGGIAPQFGRDGKIITISQEEWQRFNPEVIYGCGSDRQVPPIFEQSGWKDVDAVRNGRLFFYPCDLTCRAATHTGSFVSLLAANIYPEEFSDFSRQVLPEQVIDRTTLTLDLEYVDIAEIIESDIRDFRNKSVIVKFNRPMQILSTLEGWRDRIEVVGNHYWPPPTWRLGHSQGLTEVKQHTLQVLGIKSDSASLLFTGANMDNLAVVKKSYREMEVTALVTAGVAGNAVRMAADEGKYYELDGTKDRKKPGTINILLLTNTHLSPRAMTRGMISATEAKTAALQDLDIRSTYSPTVNAATGTGTDNILVVEGMGAEIDASGGHTKMGELIARAVYKGVMEAVSKQNGLTANRSIFQRIKERKTTIRTLCAMGEADENLTTRVEQLLLDSRYSSFLEAALAISDAYERGGIRDLTGFDSWCSEIAKEIAQKPVKMVISENGAVPIVLRKAMGAFVSGLQAGQ